jgi:hypothetical protein
MILIGNAVITDDLKTEMFVCDVEKCKGACCVEGDLGAPLEQEELQILDDIYPEVKPYLSEAGVRAIEDQGTYVRDYEDDFSTPTVGGRECAYAIYDAKGILKCEIEKAWSDGKTQFRKPISCHLYPVRITKYDDYDALNYDQWKICSDACTLGEELKVPLYKFLREALVRKYGEGWYAELVEEIEGKDQLSGTSKENLN